MAVLSASKAYPRGGAPRRTYTVGAPLFAKMAMKFLGVEYKRGDVLPVEKMSKHKHWELWTCGKADHSPRGPFDKVKVPAVEVAQAVASEGVAVEAAEVESEVTPVVEPPKPKQRRSKE